MRGAWTTMPERLGGCWSQNVETRENRRRFKRYPAQWKAAVVFSKVDQKPILHTRTLDLSVGGAAILSDDGNLTGSVVTVLIAQPLQQGWNAPRTLKALAQVVSTVRLGGPPRFRHGLSFIQGDELHALEKLLQATATSAPPDGGGGRLAQLKQLAQAKRAAETVADSRDASEQQVSEALQRAYQYLMDLVEQLDVLKPAFAKGYAITGVPEFGDLAWDYGRADFRAREISSTQKRFEQVTLHFRLSADKQIRVLRESPASDRLKQHLQDNRIEFDAHESRNEKGAVGATNFVFPCRVRAWLVLDGDFENGKIRLSTRNVERFGITEHTLEPDAVTDNALDELAAFILGEANRIGPLLLRAS